MWFLSWQKKFDKLDKKDLIPLSVFSIALETVKDFNEKYWITTFVKILFWSEEQKIIQNKLDIYKNFSALQNYNKNTVFALLESLISQWYLYKTYWEYPLLWITELWSAVLIRDKLLWESLEELNLI